MHRFGFSRVVCGLLWLTACGTNGDESRMQSTAGGLNESDAGEIACNAMSDCPPVRECLDARACAGTVTTFQCVDSRCVEQQTERDSTACDGAVVNSCGRFRDTVCSQGRVAGVCQTHCNDDVDCDAPFGCYNSECVSRCQTKSDCALEGDGWTCDQAAGLCGI